MKTSRQTIWNVWDRQGEKYFSKRPTFISGHDIFTGPRTSPPPIKSKHFRIIKRFKADVTGTMVGRYGYSNQIQCG